MEFISHLISHVGSELRGEPLEPPKNASGLPVSTPWTGYSLGHHWRRTRFVDFIIDWIHLLNCGLHTVGTIQTRGYAFREHIRFTWLFTCWSAQRRRPAESNNDIDDQAKLLYEGFADRKDVS